MVAPRGEVRRYRHRCFPPTAAADRPRAVYRPASAPMLRVPRRVPRTQRKSAASDCEARPLPALRVSSSRAAGGRTASVTRVRAPSSTQRKFGERRSTDRVVIPEVSRGGGAAAPAIADTPTNSSDFTSLPTPFPLPTYSVVLSQTPYWSSPAPNVQIGQSPSP